MQLLSFFFAFCCCKGLALPLKANEHRKGHLEGTVRLKQVVSGTRSALSAMGDRRAAGTSPEI